MMQMMVVELFESSDDDSLASEGQRNVIVEENVGNYDMICHVGINIPSGTNVITPPHGYNSDQGYASQGSDSL
jgi:hypothetical protein